MKKSLQKKIVLYLKENNKEGGIPFTKVYYRFCFEVWPKELNKFLNGLEKDCRRKYGMLADCLKVSDR